MIKPKMKERYRKQKFLKNFGLQPNKTQRYIPLILFKLNLEVQNNNK